MEEKNIIISKDYNKIKDIKFTDPGLMADDAKEQIKHLYFSIKDLEKKIYDARAEIRLMEATLERMKKDYSRISPLFEIEFETKEKEYHTNKSTIAITGLGNDLIGKSSMI